MEQLEQPINQSPSVEASFAAVTTKQRKSSVYETIAQVLLGVLVLAVPLVYATFTSVPHEYTKEVFVIAGACIALIVWLLGVVVSGSLTIRVSPLDKGIGALVVAVIAATVFSLPGGEGLLGSAMRVSSSLLFVASLAAMYWLLVNVFDDRGSLIRLTLVTSVFIALITGLSQMLGWHVLPTALGASSAFTTVGTLNVLGILAAVLLPMFSKYGSSSHVPSRVFGVVGVIVSLAMLVILNWWVLWAVAVIGMLALVAFDSINATQISQDYEGRSGRFSLSRFIVPISVIVLGAVLLLVNFNPVSIKKDLPIEVSPTQQLSWEIAGKVLKERVVFGYGPSMFAVAFDKFAAGQITNPQFSSLRFFSGASEVSTFVVETGGLGILALALFFWSVIQTLVRFGISLSRATLRGVSAMFAQESVGTMSSLVAMVGALFLYPFNATLMFVLVVFLALASLIVVGDKATTSDIEDKPVHALGASLGFILSLILVLVGLYTVTVRYMADMRYTSGVRMADNPTKALETVASAIALDAENAQYLRDASILSLNVLREELQKPAASADTETGKKIQNLIATAVQLAQQAATIAPLDTRNWVNLATVYQSLVGAVDNVEAVGADALAKASALRPGDPAFDNRTGELWMARADRSGSLARGANAEAFRKDRQESLTKAEEAFKQAIAKVPSYGWSIYNLGAVYDRQGKASDAIAQLERIAPYNADHPTLMFELGLLYLRVGNRASAELALSRTVLLAPQYANARWYLGLLLEEKGDIKGALEQFREILKNNPENKDLQSKIDLLASGQAPAVSPSPIDTKPIQ